MKKTTIGLVFMFMLGLPLLANAAYVGTICFNFPLAGPDFRLRIDQVDDAYQVTGDNYLYATALNGGGTFKGTHISLAVTEGRRGAGGFTASHNMDFNLATFTGTDNITVRGTDGAIQTTLVQEPFNVISCSTVPPLAEGQRQAGLPYAK